MNTDFPTYRGDFEYVCLACHSRYAVNELLYTCPKCNHVFLLQDKNFNSLKQTSGKEWQKIFRARAAGNINALRGVFRFYELMAPVVEEEDILYLGEGNTPIIEACSTLRKKVGINFAIKNEGQNPSASFKDRGMACAFSYLKTLIRKNSWKEVLTICASTGDTSAAAALYASYIGDPVKSVVLLPQGKVTPQQLSQPLSSGAKVIELPGVFDDCMKVVENLAQNYRVALLNSKNAWRILGQESYAFEVAEWMNWQLEKLCIFVPIGNAGNITAILSGLIKLYELEIISTLPKVFGVQSERADPVFKFYQDPVHNVFTPVKVKPSTAQAAMIGNPVSFPRVKYLVERYTELAQAEKFFVLQVGEQEIMDSMLEANKHGHIVCTHGGECFAGLKKALALKLLNKDHYAILDSTAHMLKFADFQQKYFEGTLEEDYGIKSKKELINSPQSMFSAEEKNSLSEIDYIKKTTLGIAKKLDLQRR